MLPGQIFTNQARVDWLLFPPWVGREAVFSKQEYLLETRTTVRANGSLLPKSRARWGGCIVLIDLAVQERMAEK